MKRWLYIAISILGIGAILGGCAGSGNNQSNTVVAEASDDAPWFVGCWSSDDGSLLYIDDEIEDRGTNGKMGHLYFEFTMDRPYDPNSDYRKCGYIYDKYNDSWVFETYVDVDGDLMGADYFRGNEEAKTIYGECNGKEIVFHKDPSVAERISKKIGKPIAQQNVQHGKGVGKIPSEHSWLFGGWSSGKESFLLKEPNFFNPAPSRDSESEGWKEFSIDGETMFVDIPHIKGRFTLIPSEKMIVSEEGVRFKKVFGSDVPFPIKGAWRANNGDFIYIVDDILYEGVDNNEYNHSDLVVWSLSEDDKSMRLSHDESFSVFQYYESSSKDACYEETAIEYTEEKQWFIVLWSPEEVRNTCFYNDNEDTLVGKETGIVFHRESVNERQIKKQIKRCIKMQKKAAKKKTEGANENASPQNMEQQAGNSYLVVGEWVYRHGKTGDLNRSQEYEEGVRFNSDMTGVYNSFIATYRGLDMTDRKRTGSFTFTWDIVGDDVYITVNGERSHEYTYSMYGTLTDSGGNVFKRQ